MKLLLVANGFPPTSYGGVEVYSYDLARGLAALGHNVTVFCRDSDTSRDDYVISEDRVDNIPVIRVVNDYKTIRNFSETYSDRRIDDIYVEILHRVQPDLVHFNHLIALSAKLPQITASENIPSLVTLHDYWAVCNRVHLLYRDLEQCGDTSSGERCKACMTVNTGQVSWKRKIFNFGKKVIPFQVRLAIRYTLGVKTPVLFPINARDFRLRNEVFRTSLATVARLITPSVFVKNIFVQSGYSGDQIEVVPLGVPKVIDRDVIEKGRGDVLRFGFIGSLIPVKGIETLIEAFHRIPNEKVHLDIYGREDVNLDYVKKLHDTANGDDRIRFCGSFSPDDRDRIYNNIDVLVLPSIAHETFSLVIREALVAGCPVIASEVGAIPEAIIAGVNGFLFRPGDVADLAGKMGRIANNPSIINELTLPGPIQILSVDEHISKMVAIYQQIRTGYTISI